MPSTYSTLKLQLMATGENNTSWGDVTNVNLGTALEEAIAGTADVPMGDADQTLTLVDTNTTQTARNMRLNLTSSTITAPRNLVVPNIEKMYLVNNSTAYTITVKTAAGSGQAVASGKSFIVFCDGNNVMGGLNYTQSLLVGNLLSPVVPVMSAGDAVMSGKLGVGTSLFSTCKARITWNATGGAVLGGVNHDATIQSDVTSSYSGYATNINTQAVAFACGFVSHYNTFQGVLGAGSSIGTQVGYTASPSLIGATTNIQFYAQNSAAVTAGKSSYAFYTDQNVATGGGTTYSFYAAGTAPSIFNGPVAINGTLNLGGTIQTGTGVSTGGAVIELGGLRTGDGLAYMDFHASSGSDFEGRILRNAGVNGNFDILNGGSGSLTFGTAGGTRMWLDSSGRLGINKSAPTVALDVVGAITATGNITGGDISASRPDGSGVIFLGTGHYLYWDTANYIMPGPGNLIVSGQTVLTAASTGANFTGNNTYSGANAFTGGNTFGTSMQSFRLPAGNTAASSTPAIEVMNQSSTSGDAYMSFHNVSRFGTFFGLDGATNDIFVGGFSWGAGVKHRVWHAGNFDPNTKANLGGASFTGDIGVAGTAYFNNSIVVGNGQSASSITMYDSDEGSRTLHCNSNQIGFLTQAGGWGSYCNDDGSWTSVGALRGTDVYASGWLRTTGATGVYFDNYGQGIISAAQAGSPHGNVSIYGAGAGGWQGYAINNWCTFMRSANNSQYGIYNTTANHWGLNLDNAGNATFVGNVNANGAIIAAGNVVAFSDAKLKTNLEPITDALTKVGFLTGYTYDRVDQTDGRRHTGLIAQDVQAVLPEAVGEHEGTLTLAYGNMVGLLVEAIKELRAEVAELRERLA